jgi:murein DD-endopeptidase MepM/ murein hydrolase activator NlpD
MDFQFSGPAPDAPSRFRGPTSQPAPPSVTEAADQWSGYRYARPEDEFDGGRAPQADYGYHRPEHRDYPETRYPAARADHWTQAPNGVEYADGTDHYGTDQSAGSPLAQSLLDRARSANRPRRVAAAGTGSHRLPAPPAALRGRAAVLAVAAGAMVAAGQSALAGVGTAASADDAEQAAATTAQAAPGTAQAAAATNTVNGAQMIDIAEPLDRSQFADVFSDGKQLAKDRAAQEEAQDRPLFVLPVRGAMFTSGFGMRWGAMHQGVDMAAPIGTPIYAVEDGTVISAGPASGFGMWVRLQHADGTITVYGHVNTATVSVGQRVEAGDQIATVGNRGYSTGPHCHFEVWKDGVTKIDPLPWLASRGISLGPEED